MLFGRGLSTIGLCNVVLLSPLYIGGGRSPPLSYSQPCLLRLRREKCRERIAGGGNSPNVVDLCTIYLGSFFCFQYDVCFRAMFLRKTVVNSAPFWSRPVQGRVCKGVEKEEQECDNTSCISCCCWLRLPGFSDRKKEKMHRRPLPSVQNCKM